MQDHLKERLTGAAILVIVVVLLVPELFRGRPTVNLRSGALATTGPPLRSYTIDLRDSATAQPPGASVPTVAVASSAAAGAPNAAASIAPASHAAPQPVPARSAAPTPEAAPAAPAAAASAPAAHAGAVKAGWAVQVGSFARRDYAERMVKQVAAKGYTVVVAGPDDHGLYRVRSPPQSERAAALALKQKMMASGLKPMVSTVP